MTYDHVDDDTVRKVLNITNPEQLRTKDFEYAVDHSLVCAMHDIGNCEIDPDVSAARMGHARAAYETLTTANANSFWKGQVQRHLRDCWGV